MRTVDLPLPGVGDRAGRVGGRSVESEVSPSRRVGYVGPRVCGWSTVSEVGAKVEGDGPLLNRFTYKSRKSTDPGPVYRRG